MQAMPALREGLVAPTGTVLLFFEMPFCFTHYYDVFYCTVQSHFLSDTLPSIITLVTIVWRTAYLLFHVIEAVVGSGMSRFIPSL